MALMFGFGAAWREPASTAEPQRLASPRPAWLDPRAWRTRGAAFGAAAAHRDRPRRCVAVRRGPPRRVRVDRGRRRCATDRRARRNGSRTQRRRTSGGRTTRGSARCCTNATRTAAARSDCSCRYYRGQVQGRELVNSQNVVVHPSDPRWRAVSRTRASRPWGEASRAGHAHRGRGARRPLDGRGLLLGRRSDDHQRIRGARCLVLAAKLAGPRRRCRRGGALHARRGIAAGRGGPARQRSRDVHGAAIERALRRRAHDA